MGWMGWMGWMGVKSRFSNNSSGEPVSLAIPKFIEADLPDKLCYCFDLSDQGEHDRQSENELKPFYTQLLKQPVRIIL